VLRERDEVFYSAAVAAAVPDIVSALANLDPHPDYANVLEPKGLPKKSWFSNWFRYYRAFTKDSLAAARSGSAYVVLADIAGYYEEVDLYVLRSDLLSMGVDRGLLDALMSALYTWGPVEKRGLPQGYSASDILGKAYLHPVDERLRGFGYHHLRWVDDFRIFVDSEDAGREALLALSKALGQRGLVLQSAKTRIVPAAVAEEEFQKTEALLQAVRDAIVERMVASGALDDTSVPLMVIDEVLTDGEGGDSVEVLEEAFERYFSKGADRFGKTLFRFVLRRLGKAGSTKAVHRVLELLWEQPQETPVILEYVALVGAVADLEAAVVSRLDSGRLVYDYQLYLIFEWRLEQDTNPSSDFLRVTRSHLATGPDAEAWGRAILGRWGTTADLNDLVTDYATTRTSQRPDMICSLQRLELSRRNGFYGRVAAETANCARAVAAVKNGKVVWA
jgi:hypothetical protein